MQQLSKEVTNLFSYLSAGVSAYHVAAHSRQVLLEAGFKELPLKETWKLEKGGRYFCMPFGTTLYAFTIGSACELANGIHIGGAHTDFPAIKIKPRPEIFTQGYMQLNTEVYGGPILNTFFDRPLSLAGRVVTRGERYDRPVSHLVDFKEPVLYLPNLAVHMNREVNEKGVPIDNQKHLLPLLGTIGEELNKETTFTELLAERFDHKKEDILDYDLCVYNTEQPYKAGITGEFICAPRLDDITSVCALVHGLIESGNTDRVNLVCLFDNEEIGSLSKQGADSQLPTVIIQEIWLLGGFYRRHDAFCRCCPRLPSELSGKPGYYQLSGTQSGVCVKDGQQPELFLGSGDPWRSDGTLRRKGDSLSAFCEALQHKRRRDDRFYHFFPSAHEDGGSGCGPAGHALFL